MVKYSWCCEIYSMQKIVYISTYITVAFHKVLKKMPVKLFIVFQSYVATYTSVTYVLLYLLVMMLCYHTCSSLRSVHLTGFGNKS